jgi:hypothetical protein
MDCQGTGPLPTDVVSESSLRINRLYSNQPNPFNPTTLIRFRLAQDGPVEITVYDVRGRLIRTLVDAPMSAGPHSVDWDGKDVNLHPVSSGIYWIQMRAGPFVSNKKMVVLR